MTLKPIPTANGDIKLQDTKTGKLAGSVQTKGKEQVPTASSKHLVQDPIPGFEAKEPEVSTYEAQHEKLLAARALALKEFGSTVKELKKIRNREAELQDALREKGSEILNSHRPTYDLALITLDNQGEWDTARRCTSCETRYPCNIFSDTVSSIDELYDSPIGSRVATMLEEYAIREARDTFPKELPHGLVRGEVFESSSDQAEKFPIGTVIRLSYGLSTPQRFLSRHGEYSIKTANKGWAYLGSDSNWGKKAKDYLGRVGINVAHPETNGFIWTVESFVS